MTDEPTDKQPDTPKPPWGDDESFNPEKAWKLIQDLRSDNKELKKRPVRTPEDEVKLSEYDQITEAAKSDLDKANESVSRWQSDAEKWRSAAVSQSVRALAAADFEYPEDAVNALDTSRYLGAGGEIDEKAIQKDLAGLLEARPNWARAAATPSTAPRAPLPNTAQGRTNGTPTNDPATEFGAILQGAMARR